MLRCPPSRISLTSSDVADYERRLAARQTARFGKANVANIRLSEGPARSTSLSLVPAGQNVGRKRAASSSSEATLHNDYAEQSSDALSTNLPSSGTRISGLAAESQSQHLGRNPAVVIDGAASATRSVTTHGGFQLNSSPRRQVDSFYGTEQIGTGRNQLLSAHGPANAFHVGVSIAHTDRTSVEIQSAASVIRSGYGIEGDTITKIHCTTDLHYYNPPALSSARARRRHARSRDVCVPSGASEAWNTLNFRDIEITNHINDQAADAALPVPALTISVEDSQLPPNPALDPGAPIFIPRTRFGIATGSSADSADHNPRERYWSSVDSTHSSSKLRIRSSSEQNAAMPTRLRNDTQNDTTAAVTEYVNGRDAIVFQSRRRRRSADQNTAMPFLTPNLERYPLMRPPSSLNSQRRISNFSRHLPHDGSGLQLTPSYAPLHLEITPTLGNRQTHAQIRLVSADDTDGAQDQNVRLRSVSPAPSTSSRSTPNLLRHPPSTYRTYSRESSLAWPHITSRTFSFNRVPSMVSAASGTSGAAAVTRQSSREGLDAAAEFLRMRNSPLDNLTEKLSRLSASRQRSVGRSWERPPRPRISLLSGDPFRSDLSRDRVAVNDEPSPGTGPVVFTSVSEDVEQPESAEDLIALSLALPPSSPLQSSPEALPSTPPVCHGAAVCPQSPLAHSPHGKLYCSPGTAIRRKPVPTTATTPKVAVYDESKPPATQPRIPADIGRSKRRIKARSETTVDISPVLVGRAMISSPPPIPVRHPHHRFTYPSGNDSRATPGVSILSSASSIAMASTTMSGAARHRRAGRHAQRSSEQAENELEGHLRGLEEDRHTCLGRREDGSLDVTPPKEGRYERYLS